MITLKVFVDGAFSSGKTEFIRCLSEVPLVSTQKNGYEPTPDFNPVALDFGRFIFDDNAVLYMFGAPGARRMDYTWSIFDEIDIGIIMMIDSSCIESFREAQAKLHGISLYLAIPVVVAANYQDKPDAWHPDDLRIAFKIDDEILVLPCCAKTGEGVSDAMIALCEEYLRLNAL